MPTGSQTVSAVMQHLTACLERNREVACILSVENAWDDVMTMIDTDCRRCSRATVGTVQASERQSYQSLHRTIANAMATHPLVNRQLFGGAIELAFPQELIDISDFRPVPDHQEVSCSYVCTFAPHHACAGEIVHVRGRRSDAIGVRVCRCLRMARQISHWLWRYW